MATHPQRKRLLVTLPDDVRKWLRTNAEFNGGTQSSEVVRALRERMVKVKAPRSAVRAQDRGGV